ncbi:MAG: M28 family peptidase [Clostridia bacterium]|nr:M28 family peptidase [Clostridia bacterium]
MKALFDEINGNFPVRNTKEQKAAFSAWVVKDAEKSGLNASVTDDNGHKNIVIGDPERAKVIFTAHYDTPWQSPWPNLMLPKNRGLFLLYQIGIVLPFLLLSFLAAFLVMKIVPLDYAKTTNRLLPLYAYLFTYYVLFYFFMRGRKNKKNFNDNTSGVATVLQIAKTLKAETRGKAAFILFDNEERGKKGSKAFSKAHRNINENTPIVNFDCVGLGDQIVVIEKEDFKAREEYKAFRSSFGAVKNVHFLSSKKAHANSDQTSFKLGNAVMACRKSKSGILYVNRIHTSRDTVVDIQNLCALKEASVSFIEAI